jgi:hypothetical protein
LLGAAELDEQKETAGPSTALRSGRDDNFVLKVDEFARKTNKVTDSPRDDKGEGGDFY